MVREASSFGFPRRVAGANSAQPMHAEAAKGRQGESLAPESVESEISRLTWAVLDGSATDEQRRQLATLVNAQHARRQR